MGADVIIKVPEEQLIVDPRLQPNRGKISRGGKSKYKYEGADWSEMVETFSPQCEYPGLLVRTALLCSKHYDDEFKGPRLRSDYDMAEFLKFLSTYKKEYLAVLAIRKVSNTPAALYEMLLSKYTSEIIIDILKVPFLCGAQTVVVAVNHTSGSHIPNKIEIKLAKELSSVFSCIGMRLMNFIVMNKIGWSSALAVGVSKGVNWKS